MCSARRGSPRGVVRRHPRRRDGGGRAGRRPSGRRQIAGTRSRAASGADRLRRRAGRRRPAGCEDRAPAAASVRARPRAARASGRALRVAVVPRNSLPLSAAARRRAPRSPTSRASPLARRGRARPTTRRHWINCRSSPARRGPGARTLSPALCALAARRPGEVQRRALIQ